MNIDTKLLRLFQIQLLSQCEFILMAADDLDRVLTDTGLSTHEKTTRLFFSIQNMLTAAANISKALWGQGKSSAAQRQDLRISIGISDDSPLHDRKMRNNFEHLDERLDEWWETSKSHNYADLNIGAISTIPIPDAIDQFRLFDPNTADVVFWGQQFNLRSLIDEVHGLLPKLRAEAMKPPWEA